MINKANRLVIAMALLSLTGLARAADAPETVEVTSSAFAHHGTVPLANTAYSDNQSIDLSWSNLPAGTVELALICDDPVVAMPQPFVHWVVYNIPASAAGLPAGMSSEAAPEIPGLEGLTNGVSGVRRPGYFGPRPPVDGQLHTYNFRVYALDADLDLPEGLGKDELLERMEGHVLATGLLMGHYQRTE
ncbi:MAG: YbhB/YbcL family Raf kinase inhibitor-like protein [Gammaproteobacteria bacterium]|nr:YbhB/YbcL family Raf kinase inhibitor-like protein [Pseudomonadales bacterium]MCP5346732.1 YbhB/YbcL family Raf kinase inhibitor-like protein [Pseudomonadales bacterium]